MAWKGSVLRLKELRNCVAIFQNSVSTSNIIAVNAKHSKICVRTWSAVCHRSQPAVRSLQFNAVTTADCLNLTGRGSYLWIGSSYGTEQSAESGETPEKKSQARIVITYEELKELIKKQEILLIDVREPKEVEQTGMMPGAINIPLTKLKSSLGLDEAGFKATYERAKPPSNGDNLVFYGLSNVRSEAALELAYKAGYKKARHYPGGWQEWTEKEAGS